MSTAFFEVPLTLKVKPGGDAELWPPKILHETDYQYFLIREDGKEAIVKVAAESTELKRLASDKDCNKLTMKQRSSLQQSYSEPKTKQRYRKKVQFLESEEGIQSDDYIRDEKGNIIVDTIQTVRSGTYLIDVPLVQE